MSKGENSRFQWSIVGHQSIVSYLQNNLEDSQIAHAYLFVGPEHIGKTTVSENFVNSLVCENLDQEAGAIPCGQCQHCRQVAKGIHPDVFWVQRTADEKNGKLKKNISIEQMRELQNKLGLHSFLDSYKVAVINEASTLSPGAANSLLKTLEEPTPKTVIVLLAANLARLPQTIFSRCQVLRFLPVSDQEIFDYLLSLKVERKKARVLAALSFGRPGVAANYSSDPDCYNNFQDQVKQFVILLKSDINERFKMIGELIEFNNIDSAKEVLLIWNKVLRDLILIKHSAEDFISNLKLLPDLRQLAATYSNDSLLRIMSEVNSARRYLEHNVNPKLTLENLVLNF